MYRLLVFSSLVIVFIAHNVNAAEVKKKCDFEALSRPCYQKLEKVPAVKLLHRIIDVFEDGVEKTCEKLDDVIECVENATEKCEDNDAFEERLEVMKKTEHKLCHEDKQDILKDMACLNSTTFKNEIDSCEHILESYTRVKKPSCELLHNATDCIDDAVEKCDESVEDTVEYLFDTYLENYFLVENCDLHDAASMSLPTLAVLFFSLFFSLFLSKF